MDINNVNRDFLKSVLLEILEENPKYFKQALQEILEENRIIAQKKEDDERTSKLRAMIEEDFDKYDDVFKALA